MKAALSARIIQLRAGLRRALQGPQALAFLPALALAAFWLGGEPALVLAALGLPVLILVVGATPQTPPGDASLAGAGDLVNVVAAGALVERALARARAANLSTACFVIELEGLEAVAERAGDASAETLRDLSLNRLRNMLRRDDHAVRMSDRRYLVLLGPSLRLDLESLLQLATRLQSALEEPASIDNSMRYLSASIGFCGSPRLSRNATGSELLEAAQIALTEALGNGPSAIRAWSDQMRAAHSAARDLRVEVDRALANGQIQPWFQPQLCTSTGEISGVEALARWIHPQRGIVPPAQFLRCLEETGQMDRLGQVVLQHALTALRSWDEAGLEIPQVGVNFSDAELRDPQLVDRIKWELDRFGLSPQRLCVEVLETVIAGAPEGVVARNIVALGRLGCHLDLDDFGTGHASIAALRRFRVHRLKIDRSFVARVDRDEEQHRMLAAILGMADRLGLETLAEGVESVGEHALLSQLGCDHVQGFGIARPMPADQLVDWAGAHAARIADARKLGRSSG
ncbi:putative bifunctional diguanylate cyclase/phosphodiesterase [Pseudoponticoccus marisrubri]|uniref:Diguanylate cyclase n=1 Tax=Pseudoponticoccus marisrubri TaxID=1685382 RepID=A0A0W7WPR6_9RHOB|nr:GGDEF domain-containing phosphodiesterase [Pseudoponticoccus marisrubri]KUF12488.1 diguanylate cyclase [Pseudoponticoccus marisrubri]